MKQLFASPGHFATDRAAHGRAGSVISLLAAAVSASVLVLVFIAHLLPSQGIGAAADVASPFLPHAVAGLIGGIAAHRATCGSRGILIGAAAATVSALSGLAALNFSAMPFSSSGLAPARNELRVLAINGWHEHPDPATLEHGIERANADIVVLTEVGPDRVAMLGRLKARYPHQIHCAEQWICSVAILSRLPIVSGKAGRRSGDEPPMAVAQVDASLLGMGRVSIVGSHLHRPSRNPWRHRLHARVLADAVAAIAGPVIVAGDFNATPFSASLVEFVRRTGLKAASHPLPTWPAWPVAVPQFAFDHVFVSSGLRRADAGLGPETGSDHRAVWVKIVAAGEDQTLQRR